MSAVAAQALADRSIPVFPCNPDKRPATAQGFNDASVDPTTINRWWRQMPDALVGVPTGAASGFDVLDVDPRHGGEKWWLRHAPRISQTRMHRTRSAGLHVLFQHAEPVRNTAAKLGPGIDTRGQGGYIIWWPAHGCGVAVAPVTPWPAWLLRALLAEPAKVKPFARTGGPALDPSGAAQRIAARALDKVATAAAGQRHNTLRKAAYTIGGLLDRLPFSGDEAYRRLCRAAQAAGAKDMANAMKTAAWGLEKGRAAPLSMERR